MEFKNDKIKKVFVVAFVAVAFLKVNFKKQANFLVKAMQAAEVEEEEEFEEEVEEEVEKEEVEEETKIKNFKEDLELEEIAEIFEKKKEQIDSDLKLNLNGDLSEEKKKEITTFFENIKTILENLLNAINVEEIWGENDLNEIYNHFNQAFNDAIESLLNLLKIKYVMYINDKFLVDILKYKFKMQLVYEVANKGANLNSYIKSNEESFIKIYKEVFAKTLQYCKSVVCYEKKDFLWFCVLDCFSYVIRYKVIENFFNLTENSNLKKTVQESLDAIIKEQQNYGEEYVLNYFNLNVVIANAYYFKKNVTEIIEKFNSDYDFFISTKEEYFKDLEEFFTTTLNKSFLVEGQNVEEKNFNTIYENLRDAFLEKVKEIVEKIVVEEKIFVEDDYLKKELLKEIAKEIICRLIHIQQHCEIAKNEKVKEMNQKMCVLYFKEAFKGIFNFVLNVKDEEKNKVYFEIFKLAAVDYAHKFKNNYFKKNLDEYECEYEGEYEDSHLDEAVKEILKTLEEKQAPYKAKYDLDFFKLNVSECAHHFKKNVTEIIEEFNSDYGFFISTKEGYFKDLEEFFTITLNKSFLVKEGIAEKILKKINGNLKKAFLEKIKEIVGKIVVESDCLKKDLLKKIARIIIWYLINIQQYYKIVKVEQVKEMNQQMREQYFEDVFKAIFNRVLDDEYVKKDEEKKKVYLEIFEFVAVDYENHFKYVFFEEKPKKYEGSDLDKAVKACLIYIEEKKSEKEIKLEEKEKEGYEETTKPAQVEMKVNSIGAGSTLNSTPLPSLSSKTTGAKKGTGGFNKRQRKKAVVKKKKATKRKKVVKKKMVKKKKNKRKKVKKN